MSRKQLFFTLATEKARYWPKGGTPLQRVLLSSSTDWMAPLNDLTRYVNAEVFKFRIGHSWSSDATPILLIWIFCDPTQSLESAENWKPPPVFHLRTRPTFHNLWMKNRGFADSVRLYALKVAAYNGLLSPTIVERMWEEIQAVMEKNTMVE